jgi:hypothetical protein
MGKKKPLELDRILKRVFMIKTVSDLFTSADPETVKLNLSLVT